MCPSCLAMPEYVEREAGWLCMLSLNRQVALLEMHLIFSQNLLNRVKESLHRRRTYCSVGSVCSVVTSRFMYRTSTRSQPLLLSIHVSFRLSTFRVVSSCCVWQQTDMPKICASVVDRETPLDDGFKFLINNFAGLDA